MGKKTVAKKIEGLQKRSFKNKKDNVIEHVSLASPISKKLKAVKSPSKTLTMRQLSKYKDLLSAISNVSSDTEKLAIMNSMQDKEFQMLCGCINSIVYDKGPMKGKLSNDEFSSLKSSATVLNKDECSCTKPVSSWHQHSVWGCHFSLAALGSKFMLKLMREMLISRKSV